jgi:outer membrane protein assembly factor BamB
MPRRTRWLAVFALLAASAGGGSAGGGSPTLSLQPESGPPTTAVDVTGAGFGADEVIDVSLEEKTVTTATDLSGAFSTTIRVPRSASAGDHRITATGETSSLVATATFTVVLPSIKLSRTIGPPTSELTVTGANFEGLERIEVVFDAKTVARATADQTGGFSTGIRVPRGAPSGRHHISATGQTSRLVAERIFRVRIDNWLQYGFDPAHSGYNPREDLLDPSTVGELSSAWTVRIGAEGALAVAFSSPAVVGGVVYMGAEDGKVYAIDAWTGAIRWTKDTGFTHDWSSPAVVGGVVYIGGGGLYALRASTGAVLWKVSTHDDTWSPAVAHGVVYASSKTGKLYAVRASDGSILWTKKTGYPGDSSTSQAPTVASGLVYVGSASQKLLALDAATGKVRWTASMGAEAGTAPAVVDGVAYAPSTESLRALDASTGALLWTATVEGGASSPAVANGVVYVGGSQGLYAFDIATGALDWNAPLGYCSESSPAVANGVVYVEGIPQNGSAGNIYALDALTGQVLWTAPVGSEGSRPDPRVVNGMVYTGSENGKVYAFALP